MSLRRFLTNMLWGSDAVLRARKAIERSPGHQAAIAAASLARVEQATAAINAQSLLLRARNRRAERLGRRAVAKALAPMLRHPRGRSAPSKPASPAHLQMASSQDFPG